MKAVSLYIHIPFCKKKCDYCDFFSVSESARKGKPNDLTDSYISALLNEAAFYVEKYGITAWKTLYLGGGTPSLLSERQVATLLQGIRSVCPLLPDAEVTMEMNPENVSESFLRVCSENGVNRISMGIQALDDKALVAVHRGCSVQSAQEALTIVEKFWAGNVSVDFIAGLPSQTYSSFRNQFTEIFAIKNIRHISLYTLTIEENTVLGKKIDSGEINWSYEKADKMWLLGRSILEKHGFKQYEISNFAVPGFESRHNASYWRLQNYIGIGAGATGTWYGDSDGSLLQEGFRWTNTRSVIEYENYWLSADKIEKNIPRNVEILSYDTMMFEFLMLGFRLLKGVSDSEFKARFGESLKKRIGVEDGVFSDWKKNRLATVQKNNGFNSYSLNRRGILLLNRFLESIM